jgi:hypothetical protein
VNQFQVIEILQVLPPISMPEAAEDAAAMDMVAVPVVEAEAAGDIDMPDIEDMSILESWKGLCWKGWQRL